MANVFRHFHAVGFGQGFQALASFNAKANGHRLGDSEFFSHDLGCNKQFRPNVAPSLLTKHLPGDDTAGKVFNAPRLNGIHIFPARDALVEVLLTDLELCGPSSADFGGDFIAHAPKYIESIEESKRTARPQANSAVIEGAMETNSERRRRKLTALCAERGLKEVAARAGLNHQSLDQVIKGTPGEMKKDGTRGLKNLGNASARAIEKAEGLGNGWFDVEEPQPSIAIKNDVLRMQVANIAKMLDAIPSDSREKAYLAAVQVLINHLP